MRNIKKRIGILVGVLLAVLLICSVSAVCIYHFNRPTVTVDFSQKTGEVTNGAAGFLYGLAEPDIPSTEITDSIDPSSLATKTAGGLQHPIGDLQQVADTFLRAGGEELLVYTQDMYDTWYYEFDSLEQYHERVRETVTKTAALPYADKVTYCIYNEMDNGAWFDDFGNAENRQKTYEAWKATYALVRSIDPNAKIGGPNYCGYNADYIKEFLEYCKSENCLPDVMIWHELGDNSLYFLQDHCDDYAALCKELGIEEKPICITEYGLMSSNGIPGESVKWIERVETAKVDGCIAYWRLANNLSEVTADDVAPNSNWWAYRFYAQMTGETVAFTAKDLFQSNMGKFLTFRSKGLRSKGFTALTTIDEEESCIHMIAGGSNRDSTIRLRNLDKTESFRDAKRLYVTAEYVDYKGLGGVVTAPKTKFMQYVDVKNGSAEIELNDILYSQCFDITIRPETGDTSFVGTEMTEDTDAMRRYEAEDATLFGTAAATDQIAYAASEKMLVMADSSKESGVEFTVKTDNDGSYVLDIVYGNGANNIQTNADGSADKGERTTVKLWLSVDGGEPQTLLLPSTIKDEFTSCVTTVAQLSAGEHTVRLTLPENQKFRETISLDFLDVTKAEAVPAKTYVQLDGDRSTEQNASFLTVVDADGYYSACFICEKQPTKFTLNGTTVENAAFMHLDKSVYETVVFLHRGVNYLDIPQEKDGEISVESLAAYGEKANGSTVLSAEKLTISNGAKLVRPDAQSADAAKHLQNTQPYIDGINCDSKASASFTYTAAQDGYYQLTFLYANNEEGGVHSYNVDLIERYLTLFVNGKSVGNVFCRNTYSWDTYKTKTVTVYLTAGENQITFSNDGSYRFNGKTTYAPQIAGVTVSPVVLAK